jgi:hypothetical protein
MDDEKAMAELWPRSNPEVLRFAYVVFFLNLTTRKGSAQVIFNH